MLRAVETAKIVLGEAGVDVCVDPRLREFDFGLWEGLTWAEICERWPRQAAKTLTDALAYRPEGGEAFADVEARVASFLADLERAAPARVLVATHAGVLHALLAVLSPRLLPEQRELKIVFSPAGITRVTMNGERARLITVNDVSHFTSTP